MKKIIAPLTLMLSLFLTNCAPVFSELGTARTVGKNSIEVIPYYSSVNESHRDAGQNNFGGHLTYGLTNRTDLRFRYEYLNMNSVDGAHHVYALSFGPKFSLLENHIAFSLPAGRAFGTWTSNTWQVHPTLQFSMPVINDKLEVNLSPKYLYRFCNNCSNLLAFNFGFNAGKDIQNWSVRPEFGVLTRTDLGLLYHQFSIGFAKRFELKRGEL